MLLASQAMMALTSAHALADASGAPGVPHRWAPASKEAVGTAFEPNGAASPVWFTVAEGILSEVFYPTVDKAQISDLEFLVSNGSDYFSEQKRDTLYTVEYSDEGMAVHISGQEKSGRYSYEQWIVTDPAEPVVRIHTIMHWNQPGLRMYVLLKPAIGNTGAQNLATAGEDGLFATKQITERGATVTAGLISSNPFRVVGAGYSGFSDGWQDISTHFLLTQTSPTAGPGNVALTGELPVGPDSDNTYDFALAFGNSLSEVQAFAQTSLSVPFQTIRQSYESGWKGYLQQIQNAIPNKRFIAESPFARRSAQIIKMHEDKRYRGAIVASLSKPAIPDADNAVDGVGGYHLVWPRDLYHAAMGLLAAGDSQTPRDALTYLDKNQQADGSWAQNFWVDGTPYWHGLQMDETAFPILLAEQLKTRGVSDLSRGDLEMIRKAAGFIMTHGPTTQEDRWEEIGGYVPSTLAAEIAALRAASSLVGDGEAAQVASRWQTMLERWTLVTSGPLGQNYYIRTSTQGTPEEPDTITLANGAGTAGANRILDGGFLELVRMGVRQATDPRILSTLAIYEDPSAGLAAPSPNGSQGLIFKRYTRDAYGAGHVGGYWPLLAGERGDYAIAAGDPERAVAQLYILERSSSAAGLIPEQTSTPSQSTGQASVGLGVAQPLVWAHAEDILLHRSIEEGKVFDAPRAP